jgi:hypothetical protein
VSHSSTLPVTVGKIQFLWRSVYLLKLPRLAKKTRVALSWVLEMIFSKDLEQMLTLRDVELISRIATSPTEMEVEGCREERKARSCDVAGLATWSPGRASAGRERAAVWALQRRRLVEAASLTPVNRLYVVIGLIAVAMGISWSPRQIFALQSVGKCGV